MKEQTLNSCVLFVSLGSGTSQGPIKHLERKERQGKGRKSNTTGKKKNPMEAHLGGFNIFTSVGFDDLHSKTLNEG